jgi:hypothetical protein
MTDTRTRPDGERLTPEIAMSTEPTRGDSGQ